VLVASADGVGTKLEVARRARVYDTVGRDLVQHCVNDILVQGAYPLFFLDYVAMGKLEPAIVSALIRGCADACRDNGLALLGGETAEMPGLYREGDFELVGVIVGAVPHERILDGSALAPGQAVLGLGSSGLHTNGFSLARRILFDQLGLDVGDRPEQLEGVRVGDALLAPHRSYLGCLRPQLDRGRIRGLAHITGGGLSGNVPRILNGVDVVLTRDSWPVPPLFRFLVEAGGVAFEEAHRALNMGVGMVVVVEEDESDAILAELREAGEAAWRIGTVAAGRPGRGRLLWA
jgi:phosphoribosylformylglycinamidine cyclo-ligase